MLQESAHYDRVVIWSEGDAYDQLVLVRLLGHYAQQRRPARLELINCADFPGAIRFIGLGQLPPEALRLLWTKRRPAGTGATATRTCRMERACEYRPAAARCPGAQWHACTAAARPRPASSSRELPAVTNGLSLTEDMALTLLAEKPHSLMTMFGRMTYFVDPLPGQGDLQMRDRVLAMEHASGTLFTRKPGLGNNAAARPPWTDLLQITDLGRAVLRGEVDFRSLRPPARWVGGVEVGVGHADWRWDERLRDVVQPDQGPSTR